MEAFEGLNRDEPGDTCVICLGAITERAVTPCSHSTFDFICLVSWLQERSTCPLCKAEVTTVTYQHRSPSDFKTYHVRRTHPPRDTSSSASIPSHTPRHQHYDGFPRRARYPYRPDSTPTTDTALLRRRYVYRNRLYSLHIGTNRISQYRNLTPQMITSSPELQSRARMWIRRELRVFSFLHTDPRDTPAKAATTSSNAEFLLTYVIAILKSVDVKASDGHAEEMLREFLGRENARLFLHELHAWLRSPYAKLEDWDRNVQYHEELPDEFGEDGRPIKTAKGARRSARSRSPTPRRRSAWRERDAMRRPEMN